MIFGLHGESLVVGIKAGSPWNSPGAEHAVHLQTTIVVKARRAMLLDDETATRTRSNFPFRLGCFVESALSFVFLKTHLLFSVGPTDRFPNAFWNYNSCMGRLKIKKKEAVMPFRQTM